MPGIGRRFWKDDASSQAMRADVSSRSCAGIERHAPSLRNRLPPTLLELLFSSSRRHHLSGGMLLRQGYLWTSKRLRNMVVAPGVDARSKSEQVARLIARKENLSVCI
jgi:hypothetical protein